MTRPPQGQTTASLPVASLLPLAHLLSVLDELPRSSRIIADDLAEFLHHHGSNDPGFDACILIDELSFTAVSYRRLTTGTASTNRATSP